MRRCFIALWPDGATQQAIVRWVGGQPWATRARLTAPADLHLTLHFLGDLDAGALERAMHIGAITAPPVPLRLDQVQAWRGGLVVLLPSQVPQPLVELHGGLAGRLGELGLPLDTRAYRPHLTLARSARVGPGEPPIEAAIDPPLRWCAGACALANRDGAHYRRVLLLQGGDMAR